MTSEHTPISTDLCESLKAQLKALYQHRLQKIILFGSHARHHAENGSDIDILLVLSDLASPGEEIRRVGGITSQLSLLFDEVISCVFTTSQRFVCDNSPLMQNIRREGIEL